MIKMPGHYSESLLRRYLLGSLSEDEQRTLEQELMVDQELFQELLRSEEELVDEYARGEISASDRQAFEDRFLTNPQRREEVEFARAFQRFLARQTAGTQESSGKIRTALRWPMIREIALASAMVTLAVLSFDLFLRVRNLERQITEAQLQRATAERHNDEFAQQLKSQTSQLENLHQLVTELQTKSSTGPELATLVLWPGVTRDARQVATVRLSSKIRNVKLVLLLEDTGYPQYQAELQTVEGKVVWSRVGLVPHQDKRGRQEITLLSPAAILDRSDYLIKLSGIKTQTTDTLATYYFQVVWKSAAR